MERIIVVLSSVLFLATWAVVIVMWVDVNQPTYTAKNHHISKEITLSYKMSDKALVLNANLSTHEPSESEEHETLNNAIRHELELIDDSSLDPWRDYFTIEEQNVSIDDLLQIFEEVDEAVSES
ncbi:hypothetical protein [Alkalibacillus haloalkaliphilus]|uniref:hypothetical protein n=1 Tax=Alkalibacillus haloalkaliphilus TaxID=94136 RepID=UPI002936B75C|nr:hypothetical protein [Alkalibacillus haloalkaliphilus]MDV2581231.1 hypothetical protein [Alkalibacillus haloalkaliphilus]